MKGIAALYVLVIVLTGCTETATNEDRLAARGLIQEDAPVKAVAQIIIAAPAAKILGLLLIVRIASERPALVGPTQTGCRTWIAPG
jgi:hypothetical protein